MAQLSRVPSVLPGDSSSIPGIYMWVHDHLLTPVPRDVSPLLASMYHCIHVVHRHKCIKIKKTSKSLRILSSSQGWGPWEIICLRHVWYWGLWVIIMVAEICGKWGFRAIPFIAFVSVFPKSFIWLNKFSLGMARNIFILNLTLGRKFSFL